MGNIIKRVYIDKFRKLSKLDFEIGRKITVLSGHNGVGKSSLLSLIASASGTNVKKIDGQKFQPDFLEYFEIDKEEKYSDYRMIVGFENEEIEYTYYKRISFSHDKSTGRGIRTLPRTYRKPGSIEPLKSMEKELKEKLGITDSMRVPVPTIYVSLSRLYPPGESSVSTTAINKQAKVYQKKYYEKYKEWYNSILPDSILVDSDKISVMKKDRTENSKLFMNLKDSTAKTQSVGQDNLGSIISALVDFYALSLEKDYQGGLLFIDEIEASLHPSALIKLFTLLDQVTEGLKLQILLTSHSLTILKEIINKQTNSSINYQLVYLKGLRDPNVTKYINYSALKSDLFDEIQSVQPTIKIYCEDDETAKLFEIIVNIALQHKLVDPLPKYKILPVYLGCEQLKELPKNDIHFNSVLIVLDGDAKSKTKIKIEEWLENKNIEKGKSSINLPDNIVTLPGFLSPEGFMYKIIYTYCKEYLEHQNFWRS
ncbi:TPA: AAA family ATPase, partial [Listeria innocua]|nr:AAA family ATPase [Listeria innocua]